MQLKRTYSNSGTCSSSVSFRLESGKVFGVEFEGGCSGNLQGIARLIEGMEAREALRKLKGIRCDDKPTSCPDQLARALERALEGM